MATTHSTCILVKGEATQVGSSYRSTPTQISQTSSPDNPEQRWCVLFSVTTFWVVHLSMHDTDCGVVPNDVISCFPTPGSTVLQNQWTRLVCEYFIIIQAQSSLLNGQSSSPGNKALPQFSQTNLVDVYLMHADSGDQVLFAPNQPYLQGYYNANVNDTWWGSQGPKFTPGTNSTQTFFFIMVANGMSKLSQPPQATFTAIREWI